MLLLFFFFDTRMLATLPLLNSCMRFVLCLANWSDKLFMQTKPSSETFDANKQNRKKQHCIVYFQEKKSQYFKCINILMTLKHDGNLFYTKFSCFFISLLYSIDCVKWHTENSLTLAYTIQVLFSLLTRCHSHKHPIPRNWGVSRNRNEKEIFKLRLFI